MSNIVALANGTINKQSGTFVDLKLNAAVFCALKGDLLTNGQKLEAGKSVQFGNVESMSAIEKVMAAQAYLGDEDTANDSVANELVTNKLAENKEIPAVLAMAMLMKYEYLLSIENISEAEDVWNELLEHSANVPGDMNPQSLEEINGASLFLMKKLTGI